MTKWAASKRDPRGRDVRAADLQEKPTKRAKSEIFQDSRFRRRRRLSSEHRSERSESSDTERQTPAEVILGPRL
jgi:hypothetical protein